MLVEMKFNKVIIKYLSDQCGVDVSTASGATALANDIEGKTGERLAANTLKRLVGVLPYDFSPRGSTLDIIAAYLGYSSWELFISAINDRVSAFNAENPFIDVSALVPGTRITFGWEPDREISLRCMGGGRCEVIEVANSKLSAGDILVLSQLAEGYPLVAKKVIRNGRNNGSYVAAKITGISNINIIR